MSRGLALTLAVAWAMFTAPAGAATPLPDAPPPGPPLAIEVPALSTQTLANGLRVVVASRPGLPLVTAQLVLLAGREADPADKTGLAAMTTALLARGARRGDQTVDAATLARQAEALGGTLNTATGWRSSLVAMTITPPRLPATLALMADVVRHPALAADELERERARALDALRVSLDNPGTVAGLAAARTWWGDSVYGRIATPTRLGRLTADDLRAFHAAHWRPDRVVLVLAGDIRPAEGLALAQQTFGDWPQPQAPLPPPPQLPSPAATAPPLPPVLPPVQPPALWVDMPGSGQSAVTVSAPSAPQGQAAGERVVADVAQALLGGGYSARLNQVIRIERGLSYGAFGSSESHPSGGRWMGQAQTQQGSAAEVAQLLREAVMRLSREPAPQAELAARQAALVGDFARALETTAGLAGVVTAEVAAGRDPLALKGYVAAVRAVTPEQVREHAARWWTAASLRVVIAGDWQAAGDSVQTLGLPGQVRRLPKAELDLDRADLGGR